MKTAALHLASDRNVTHALRHFAVHADGAVLAETAASLLVASATAHVGAFHNAAIRVDPDADAHVVLAEMSAFGDAYGRDLVLWASDHGGRDLEHAVAAIGLRLRSTAVGMAIDTPPGEPVVPPELELIRVTDAAGVAAFGDVHRQIWADAGAPDAPVTHFASPGALLASNVSAFVLRLDGRPVSCAMVLHSGAEAGVYWVATTPRARRRGLADMVTRAATRAGFEHGAAVVVLQATELGHTVYQRIGFAAFTAYYRYIRQAVGSIRPGV